MKKVTLIVIFIMLTLLSCSKGPHTYLVYKVGLSEQRLQQFKPYPTNDTLNNYLENKLTGSKFTVQFADDYVIVHPETGEENLILHKLHNNGLDYYAFSKKSKDRLWGFMLFQLDGGTTVLQVTIGVRSNYSLYNFTQLGGNLSDTYYYNKQGVAQCYLSKVD